MQRTIAVFGREGEERFKEQMFGRQVMASRQRPSGTEYPGHWKPQSPRDDAEQVDNRTPVSAGSSRSSGAGSQYPSAWGGSVAAANRTSGRRVRITTAGD